MSLKKFTIDTVDKEKNRWIKLVVENEMRLVRLYLENKESCYDKAERNAWIVKTLVDKKQRYRFKECKNVVMVGSGIYPYSMFDLHKQYPHINQVGLEIEENRAMLSRRLISSSPAKNSINIITCDAINYDYSWLESEDFVFISVDVEGDKIFSKVLKTSKAQPLVCAPYKYTWLANLIKSNNVMSVKA
tara:strand:- start:23186 stop:23752 length:567 start_codon:yes stop_codon:yes gene_type:complete